MSLACIQILRQGKGIPEGFNMARLQPFRVGRNVDVTTYGLVYMQILRQPSPMERESRRDADCARFNHFVVGDGVSGPPGISCRVSHV
jgi:hypothetical protein